MLQAKNAASKATSGECETLLLNVVVPEVHQNDHSHELKKPQNCQNWAVGACAGMGAYLGQYSKTFLYKKEMLLVGTLPVRGV